MKRITTTDKAQKILNTGVFTKKTLSEELDISRPTLDSRLFGQSEWKKLEVNWINTLLDDN